MLLDNGDDDGDGPVKDVINLGLESLTDGTTNPLCEFNNTFERLQKRRKMSPGDVPPATPKSETLDPEPTSNRNAAYSSVATTLCSRKDYCTKPTKSSVTRHNSF
jgi:hypothetical protein